MLTELILKITTRTTRKLSKLEERSRIGRLEAWVSMIINGLLFAVKLALGLMINSLSLIADAIHTLSDVATSIVVLFGFKLSGKPADKEHPYGHGRIEYVTTLIIAIMLGVVGFEFIKSAVGRLVQPVPISAGWGILAAIFFTILVKVWLGKFSLDLGNRIDSSTLKADAWHHTSDAISSVLVLIAVWGSQLGYPALDGIGGVLVGVYLIYSGFAIAREAINPLIGEPPSPELIHQIRQLCRTQPKVMDAHDIIVHNYGQYKFLGLHIEVNSKLTAQEAHDVAESVSAMLEKEQSAYSTVHIDPIDPDNEAVHEVLILLEKLVPQSEVFVGFHDVRVVSTPEHKVILFDVDLGHGATRAKQQAVRWWLESELVKAFPNCEAHINISPIHTY